MYTDCSVSACKVSESKQKSETATMYDVSGTTAGAGASSHRRCILVNRSKPLNAYLPRQVTFVTSHGVYPWFQEL